MSGEQQIRRTRRQEIEEWFAANVGRRMSTYECHMKWGTAFRSRVSEINRDASCAIVIRNEAGRTQKREHSIYWSEARPKPVSQAELFQEAR